MITPKVIRPNNTAVQLSWREYSAASRAALNLRIANWPVASCACAVFEFGFTTYYTTQNTKWRLQKALIMNWNVPHWSWHDYFENNSANWQSNTWQMAIPPQMMLQQRHVNNAQMQLLSKFTGSGSGSGFKCKLILRCSWRARSSSMSLNAQTY